MLAKDTFTKVGERLQQRRKKDEEYDHNAYLYDDYAPGPIDENDEVLMEKLKMSKTVADEKTAKVILYSIRSVYRAKDRNKNLLLTS